MVDRYAFASIGLPYACPDDGRHPSPGIAIGNGEDIVARSDHVGVAAFGFGDWTSSCGAPMVGSERCAPGRTCGHRQRNHRGWPTAGPP